MCAHVSRRSVRPSGKCVELFWLTLNLPYPFLPLPSASINALIHSLHTTNLAIIRAKSAARPDAATPASSLCLSRRLIFSNFAVYSSARACCSSQNAHHSESSQATFCDATYTSTGRVVNFESLAVEGRTTREFGNRDARRESL